MKIVAILQARLGSTRLPGKVLLPLAGKSMVQNIVERVRRCSLLDYVIVAYPLKDHDAFKFLFTDFIGTAGVSLGAYASQDDENDLVARYLSASRAYDPDLIVRVPCDNPCIDQVYVDEAIRTYCEYPFVYYSNTTAECDEQMVDGIGAEVFSISRLQWLDRLTQGQPVYREHPHKYFEECGLLQLPKADVRLDVNTQADYEFIKDMYDHFGHNRFSTQEVLSYLAVTPHGQR